MMVVSTEATMVECCLACGEEEVVEVTGLCLSFQHGVGAQVVAGLANRL